MTIKEIYQKFEESSNIRYIDDLKQKYKTTSLFSLIELLTEDELTIIDEISSKVDLKSNAESIIEEKLFKRGRKFKLNDGSVLKITRGTTRNDGGVCFKVSTETKSDKLEYSALIKAMYGLRKNYYGQIITEYISDEFKNECDNITLNLVD
jgi:hypothetical protein